MLFIQSKYQETASLALECLSNSSSDHLQMLTALRDQNTCITTLMFIQSKYQETASLALECLSNSSSDHLQMLTALRDQNTCITTMLFCLIRIHVLLPCCSFRVNTRRRHPWHWSVCPTVVRTIYKCWLPYVIRIHVLLPCCSFRVNTRRRHPWHWSVCPTVVQTIYRCWLPYVIRIHVLLPCCTLFIQSKYQETASLALECLSNSSSDHLQVLTALRDQNTCITTMLFCLIRIHVLLPCCSFRVNTRRRHPWHWSVCPTVVQTIYRCWLPYVIRIHVLLPCCSVLSEYMYYYHVVHSE